MAHVKPSCVAICKLYLLQIVYRSPHRMRKIIAMSIQHTLTSAVMMHEYYLNAHGTRSQSIQFYVLTYDSE